METYGRYEEMVSVSEFSDSSMKEASFDADVIVALMCAVEQQLDGSDEF